MMRSRITTAMLASLGPLLVGLAAPAAAQWHDAPQQSQGWKDDRGWDDRARNDRGSDNRHWRHQGRNDRPSGGFYEQGRYNQGQHDQRGTNQNWNGRHDGGWCRRSDGRTGTLIGAGVGGVIGNQVARRGDKALGTVAGAIVGGLLGRSIDSGRTVCR
ncbi:glycine zipper 2TM domain-containing protein [Sandarakinorhabdus sp.]|uniref:glycine zipper 2TM domain-containing protein n=1 Tax=Sandarakinorhabdus sp. TaxID=1916663 RepID=UPI00333EE105